MANNKPIVEIKNLTKKYKGAKEPSINNISFNVYPGNFHAFIGANGAGKTTTIKCIIGAYSAMKYNGEILIDGINNQKFDAKIKLGYIPEKAVFPKKMKTKTYLTSMGILAGLSTKQAKDKCNEILKNLNMEKLAKKYPDNFSSGQKKKILLAQALINNPSILIMDEPAANLDPMARIELFDLLKKLQAEGKAIFISSHILDEVSKYCNYVTILDGGKIVYDDKFKTGSDLTAIYRKHVKVGSVDNNLYQAEIK